MLIRSERGGFAGSTVGGGGFASQVMPLKPELALCAGK